jgi:hypothetical protein
MRLPALLLIAAASVGCDEQFVDLQGVLVQGPDGDRSPASNATLEALDEDLKVVSETTSHDDGWFRLEAPAGQRTFVQVSGPGLVTASFSGKAGLNPRQRVPTGELFAVSDELLDGWREVWDGCPGADTDGGWMIGEVQALGWRHEDGTPMIVEQAVLVVRTQQGDLKTACYLSNDGLYDPDATQTGISGRFVVPDLPPGRHRAEVTWEFANTPGTTSWFELHVPQGGIAPRWPLYMELSP